MDFTYCNDECPKGIEARNKFLKRYNSAYDAITDFRLFVKDCSKTCPYKEMHDKSEQEEE
jgi:hypothetical protein